MFTFVLRQLRRPLPYCCFFLLLLFLFSFLFSSSLILKHMNSSFTISGMHLTITPTQKHAFHKINLTRIHPTVTRKSHEYLNHTSCNLTIISQ
jgi:hypothetical protein